MVNISDFTGIWLIKSRNGVYSESTLMIIDINNSALDFYPGPINYSRVDNYYDTLITYFGSVPSFIVEYKLVGNDLYIDNGLWICSFLNDNIDELQFTSYVGGSEFPYYEIPNISAVYFKRLNEIPESLIQSIEFPNAINWNNPKLLLEYWISHFKCSYNNVPHAGTNYFSLKKFNEISKLFLESNKGIERKACIQWVYKSTNIPIQYTPIILLGAMDQTPPQISYYGTVLFINKYHKITRSDRVTISGFQGEWAVINGKWDLDPFVYANSITYPSNRAFTCSNRRYIIIPYDSRNLPEYNPLKHGNGEVKSFHKSINENSSYREMIVALDELILETGFSTHTRGYYIAIIKDVNLPPVIPETYKEIQDLLDTNPSYVVNVRFRSRTFPQSNGSMYVNPNNYYNFINGTYPSFDINNPFNVESTIDYNIAVSNYLLPSSVKTIYYKQDEEGVFTFLVGNIGEVPPDYNTLNSQIIFGYVDQTRTNENRVGYIYFPDYLFADPNNDILKGIPENPNYYVYLLIGTIMNYLITNYNIQDIIFDNRGNGGGILALGYTVACSVGGKRNYFNGLTDPTGNPCNENIYRTNYPLIDPSEMEKIVPNSVLRGTPKRIANVIIITDINAASIGDLFPNQFIGDNGDGEIGNYTKAFIVGNIDGRISGGVITELFTPVKTPDEAAIRYRNDIYGEYSIPPFSFEQEVIGSYSYANTKKFMFYFQKQTTPIILIPHDFSVIYSDMGYLPPTIKYLNNTCPNKNDSSTWQDSYFENAIRIILKCKPAIPKAYKYIQIGKEKAVSFQQKEYQCEKSRKLIFINQYPEYPQKGTTDMNDSNSVKCNIDEKFVKCFNVVVNPSEVKDVGVRKPISVRSFEDNLTRLDRELRKESKVIIPKLKDKIENKSRNINDLIENKPFSIANAIKNVKKIDKKIISINFEKK